MKGHTYSKRNKAARSRYNIGVKSSLDLPGYPLMKHWAGIALDINEPSFSQNKIAAWNSGKLTHKSFKSEPHLQRKIQQHMPRGKR